MEIVSAVCLVSIVTILLSLSLHYWAKDAFFLGSVAGSLTVWLSTFVMDLVGAI